ncbi:hypothetical protein D3C76_1713540 [compost metagenome]
MLQQLFWLAVFQQVAIGTSIDQRIDVAAGVGNGQYDDACIHPFIAQCFQRIQP